VLLVSVLVTVRLLNLSWMTAKLRLRAVRLTLIAVKAVVFLSFRSLRAWSLARFVPFWATMAAIKAEVSTPVLTPLIEVNDEAVMPHLDSQQSKSV